MKPENRTTTVLLMLALQRLIVGGRWFDMKPGPRKYATFGAYVTVL